MGRMTLREVERVLERERDETLRTLGKYEKPVLEIVPHDAQREILDSAGRWNVLALGRRAGKTTLGVYLLMARALRGEPAAWFAPTYKNLSETWRTFSHRLRPAIRKQNTQERRLELYTGGTIDFWSLDRNPDLVRGRAYSRIIIDEAALIRSLKSVFYLVLRATLTDFSGDAWFLSTPRGYGEFHDLWLQGQSSEFPEWQSWQMPSYSNPFIPAKEIDAARSEMPSLMFRQEYLAEFLPTLAGGMFRREWFETAERVPPDLGLRVRAWDLAATTGEASDFTVGVLMAKTKGGGFIVLDVVRGKWSPANRDRIIRETAERDGDETLIVFEEEGGSSGKSQSLALTQLLAGFRTRAIRPTGDKAIRAAPFASQVENGNVSLLRGKWIPDFLSELEGFPDPLALHDDQVDAASYAFSALLEGDLGIPRAYYGVIK